MQSEFWFKIWFPTFWLKPFASLNRSSFAKKMFPWHFPPRNLLKFQRGLPLILRLERNEALNSQLVDARTQFDSSRRLVFSFQLLCSCLRHTHTKVMYRGFQRTRITRKSKSMSCHHVWPMTRQLATAWIVLGMSDVRCCGGHLLRNLKMAK